MTLPYPGQDFTAFQQLPAAELDKMVVNIEALATGASINKAVDANGWTIFDHGKYKIYKKRGAISFSIGASAWLYLGAIALPVGYSSITNAMFIESAVGCSDAAVSASTDVRTGASTIQFGLSNQYAGGGVSATMAYSLSITV